jgi:hypothetical protein
MLRDYESYSRAEKALSPPVLDFVAEELEAVPDMNNPRLLRM